MLTKNNYCVFQLSQCKENLPLGHYNVLNNKLKSFSRKKPQCDNQEYSSMSLSSSKMPLKLKEKPHQLLCFISIYFSVMSSPSHKDLFHQSCSTTKDWKCQTFLTSSPRLSVGWTFLWADLFCKGHWWQEFTAGSLKGISCFGKLRTRHKSSLS